MTEGLEVLPVGSMGVITKTHLGIDGECREGDVFVVSDFYPAGEETGEWLPASYLGNSGDGYNNCEPLAEFVTLHKTKEEVSARRIPTREEVAKAISSAVMGIWTENGFMVHTGERPDPDEMEFSATTDDGLEFVFSLKVLEVGGVDW